VAVTDIMAKSSNNERNARLSQYPITFVEIIFAVVIGASVLYFHEFLFPPDLSSLSFWALCAAYFAAITSWFGWHKSTTEYSYTTSQVGQARSILDAIIVITYVSLLFFGSKAGSITASDAASARFWYLWGFVAVFSLYIVAGVVRRIEHHDPEASKIHLIIPHLVVVFLAAIAYTILLKVWPQYLTSVVLWVFVLLPLATMACYRWFREWRYLLWTEKMTIAVDMDGVLVEQVVPVLAKLRQEMSVNLSKCDITDWEYPIGTTNIKAEIERAETDEKFVRQMQPIEGAVEAFRIISERFEIIIATSRDSCTDTWNHDWLKEHDVIHKGLINTRTDGKILPHVDLLIDDYIGNIEDFIRNGPLCRKAILFAQPWNKDISRISDLVKSGRVRIAHSWQTVLALLGFSISYVEQPNIETVTQNIQPKHEAEIPREHFILQAISSFIGSYFLLQGYILTKDAVSAIYKIIHWLCIPLAIAFMLLAFFFFMTAFIKNLQNIGNEVKGILLPATSVISMGTIILAWLRGIGGLEASTSLFKFFFWTGFTFFLAFAVYFVWSSWHYGGVSRKKR
jgi:5'(3')-deoxyribonucleotidase